MGWQKDENERPLGILEGIRVLDLTEGLAGAVTGLLLAEAGADVVKVESLQPHPRRFAPGYRTWERSKRSIAIALGRNGDETVDDERLQRLVATADVVLHDEDAEGERRLGLDPELCCSRHPRLIVARVGSFPRDHPDATLEAEDSLVFSHLGICDEQLGNRPGPVYLRFPFASWACAYLLASGVVARLFHRTRTGEGGLVASSLAQGALVPTTMHWIRAENPTPELARGMWKDRAVALFRCQDGRWIHAMAAPDKTPMMQAAFAKMGPEAVERANASMVAHPYFPNQGANGVAFEMHPADEWLDELWSHDIPAQAALPFGSLLLDEQSRANGYSQRVVDADGTATWQAGPTVHVDPPARIVRPASAYGADSEQVFAELDHLEPDPSSPTRPDQRFRRPLEGVRVVDLGSYVAGPFAPMLLADLGADVVKVEAPTGDALRWNEVGFESCQRGKRSVVIDLRDATDRPILEALIASADIVHHNIRMRTAERLGIDWTSLSRIRPDLVYCHLSSYGPDGPRASWPGYDQMFQASSGWEIESAGLDNPPMWLRFGVMDHLGGLTSLYATLLALYHRERTGVGQAVAGSLLAAAVLSTSEAFATDEGEIRPVAHLDHAQLGVGPTDRMYVTSDGWITVSDHRAHAFDRLCNAVGAGDLGGVEAALAALDSQSALAVLRRGDVPSTDVRLDQKNAFFDSPDNRACRLAVSYPHARYGLVEQIGAFWDFGDLELFLERSAPTLGEHSDEILAELGLERPASAEGAASTDT